MTTSTASTARTKEQLTSDFKQVDELPEGSDDNIDKPTLAHLLLQELALASRDGRSFSKESVERLMTMRPESDVSKVDGVGKINVSDDGEAIQDYDP